MSLLEVKNLHTYFKTKKGIVKAVNDVTYSLEAGQTLGIVGESGSGKSVSAMSIIKLLDGNGYIESGEITFNGRDILKATDKDMYHIRGNEISVIFQEPMTSLNPVFTVERQIGEVLQIHQKLSKKEARAKVASLLADVKIPNPERVAKQYPFQLSGGMRQRVMIAMALACEPDILIADEPTTALDVTIQAQILELMQELQKKLGMAIIMVTHDLGVIATMCDEIIVMYGGRVCERGTADEIFYNPSHEYTKGLLRSIPSTERMKERLVPIAGNPINLLNMPAGCAFCTRCDKAMKVCLDYVPMERQVAQDHLASCWLNDLALKDKAAEMAAAGESAEAVQLATGWVKNEGGEWVFDPIVAEEGGADDEQ